MVKANELRLKNWLLLGDKPCYVSSLFITHFRAVDKDGIDLGNSIQVNFRPIPLTPETLLACGFEDMKGEYCPVFKRNMIELEVVGGDYMCRLRHDWNEHGTSLLLCSIKYLHQLQNLYFALTGQELEIKL